MNRVILIGNGFDLAHDLKTGYTDFIDYFWNKEKDKIIIKFLGHSTFHGFIFEDEYIRLEADIKSMEKFSNSYNDKFINYSWYDYVSNLHTSAFFTVGMMTLAELVLSVKTIF